MGGEGIIGGWVGLRTEFGRVFPYLEDFFLVVMLLDDPFGRVGLNGGGAFGRIGGIQIQIWAGIPLFGGVFCVRIGSGRLIGLEGSRVGQAGVSGTRENEEVRFDEVTP